MTIQEFAAITGVHVRTVYNDIEANRIKWQYITIPGRMRPQVSILTKPSKYIRRTVGKPKSPKN